MLEGYIGLFVLFYVEKMTFLAKIAILTSDAYIRKIFFLKKS